jgi:arylsulfatase
MGRLLSWGLGIADDTIVCFSSDHGDHLSSHGYGKPMDKWMHPTMRASKATPYEESVHIPFLLCYPRIVQGGRRTRALFGSVDVMPTLLALWRGDPCGRAGHSLAHVVTGKDGGALPIPSI